MSDKDSTKKSDDKIGEAAPSAKNQVHVVDVSHPGKSAPSATSRPVIVGSGSYMKDPMVSQPQVKDDAGSDKASSSDKTATSGGKVIQPLSDTADAKRNEENSDEPEQQSDDAKSQAGETTVDDPMESSAEAKSQAGSDTEVSAASSESAVVDAVLGQVDEKGNAVDDSDQADDQIKQLIQEKKYFVSVSKPKQSYGSLIVTIVSIIVIVATIVVVADTYGVISLL